MSEVSSVAKAVLKDIDKDVKEIFVALIYTDCEPDDMFAILLISLSEKYSKICIVTTMRNPNESAGRVKKMLDTAGVKNFVVMAGSGGIKEAWKDPAGEFKMEEAPAYNPLVHEQTLNDSVKFINEASGFVDMFMMTAATDFVKILDKFDERKINMIYAQGGRLPPNKDGLTAAGFNWVSDMDAAQTMLKWCKSHEKKIFVVENAEYSSAFPGGSVSIKQYPELIDSLKKSSHLEVREIMIQAAAWGRHIEVARPDVCARVGGPEVIQNQFCPADIILTALACADYDSIAFKPVDYNLEDKTNVKMVHKEDSPIFQVYNIRPEPLIKMLSTLV